MADEPKSKAKSANNPADFHVQQLEARLKRLEHKRDKRVQHFPAEQREAAKDRVERDITALKKIIAKARKPE